jgi:predicted membrane channel-forming protein YqfA (hemolysin III family)
MSRGSATTMTVVGLVKTLFKLLLLVMVGAVIAGVIFAIRKESDTGPLSFEEWPKVPRNPAA